MAAILAWLTPAFAAARNGVEPAADMAKSAQMSASRGMPLLVLYTRNGCGWCDRLRREQLQPLLADPAYAERLRIVEINTDHAAPLVDFDGHSRPHAGHAQARGIRLTPTVAFYDAAGRELAPPIVGYRTPDFYAAYLTQAIDDAARRLKGGAR